MEQVVHKMFFYTLLLVRAREYSMSEAEVYLQNQETLRSLSPSPTKKSSELAKP